MTHEKNFVTAGPAADRTAGSQCQSEVAQRPCPMCGCELYVETGPCAGSALRAQRDEAFTALRAYLKAQSAAEVIRANSMAEAILAKADK